MRARSRGGVEDEFALLGHGRDDVDARAFASPRGFKREGGEEKEAAGDVTGGGVEGGGTAAMMGQAMGGDEGGLTLLGQGHGVVNAGSFASPH